LVEQLKDDGILVAPVGAGYLQKMTKVVKHNQVLDETDLGDYIFVPLTGEFGRV
jgi:protein-L-isoaspartate O-methyltransferase